MQGNCSQSPKKIESNKWWSEKEVILTNDVFIFIHPEICRSSILPHAVLTCAACHSKPFSIFMVVCIKLSQQHWVMKKTTRFGSKSDFPMRRFSTKWGKKMTESKFSGFLPLDCEYAKTKPWNEWFYNNVSVGIYSLLQIHFAAGSIASYQ